MDYSIRELRQNFYSRRDSCTTKRDYKSTRITGVC